MASTDAPAYAKLKKWEFNIGESKKNALDGGTKQGSHSECLGLPMAMLPPS